MLPSLLLFFLTLSHEPNLSATKLIINYCFVEDDQNINGFCHYLVKIFYDNKDRYGYEFLDR